MDLCELQTHWSKPLDMQRAQAVKHWFDLVEELVVKTGIRKEDIYRMDESGFPPADQGKTNVVGTRGTVIKRGNMILNMYFLVMLVYPVDTLLK